MEFTVVCGLLGVPCGPQRSDSSTKLEPASTWWLMDLDSLLVTVLFDMDRAVIVLLAFHRSGLITIIACPWVVNSVTPCCPGLGTLWPVSARHHRFFCWF